MPLCCEYPFATRRALNVSLSFSDTAAFILYTHLHPNARLFEGNETSSKVWFLSRDSISSIMTPYPWFLILLQGLHIHRMMRFKTKMVPFIQNLRYPDWLIVILYMDIIEKATDRAGLR